MKHFYFRCYVMFQFLMVAILPISGQDAKKDSSFNPEKDLLLANYDCKTDVDDLHSVAALVTLLADPSFSKIQYHAVAGAYGIQEGSYVPPETLFQLAFGDQWTDAHKDREAAVQKVFKIVRTTLDNGGDVWVAEAGQSDFTAELLKVVMAELPDLVVSKRIHVVQHSDWNESVTTPDLLEFVKESSDYHKIADGNAVGNGTPGFRTPEFTGWKAYIKNKELVEVWQHAIDLSNRYNGQEGRYLNEAIAEGGLDFSDLSEVCWILGIQHILDTEAFFTLFGNE